MSRAAATPARPLAALPPDALHPDVTSTLDRVALVDAVAAESLRWSLARTLAPLAGSPWADVAWQSSSLTGNGMPVELAFCTDRPQVRATVEVAGPEVDETERLAAAVGAAAALGAAVPADTVAQLGRRQLTGPLRYGAWLSMRRDGTRPGAGLQPGGVKVYAEMPQRSKGPARVDVHEGALGDVETRWSAAGSPRSTLRMVGVESAGGAVELYFRALLDGRALAALCRACDLSGRDAELLALLEELGGRPARLALTGGMVGWSVALDRDGHLRSFALIVCARTLCGGESRVRPSLLAAAARHGWDLARYEAATAPVNAKHGHIHGLVALGVAAGRPAAVQVGVRPFALTPTPQQPEPEPGESHA